METKAIELEAKAALSSYLMTADDLYKMPHKARRCELLKGELKEMSPAGPRHGRIAMRAYDVHSKVADWLRAGCRLVWVVYPKSRTITEYRSTDQIRILCVEEQLSGGGVLPGFSCPVEEVFFRTANEEAKDHFDFQSFQNGSMGLMPAKERAPVLRLV